MAQNAKDYAREQLGSLDLSHLDKERQTAQNTYNTSKSSLENNFNNLIDQINLNRSDARKNFNTGRTTVAENAFNQNRLNRLDTASRVAGKSGLKELGEVGNRIETGRQYSNLANEFYNTMDTLNTTEKQGRSQYDIDQQTIKNTLDQALAGIDTRGAEAQNNYNMSLGQLAESVQGRWDANANAKAALEQQKAAAAQAHQDAVNAARQQLNSLNKQDLLAIVNDKTIDQNKKVAQISARFGVNTNAAINVLRQLDQFIQGATGPNGEDYPIVNSGYQSGYNYFDDIIGG